MECKEYEMKNTAGYTYKDLMKHNVVLLRLTYPFQMESVREGVCIPSYEHTTHLICIP